VLKIFIVDFHQLAEFDVEDEVLVAPTSLYSEEVENHKEDGNPNAGHTQYWYPRQHPDVDELETDPNANQ
jgi:hypothetical protein